MSTELLVVSRWISWNEVGTCVHIYVVVWTVTYWDENGVSAARTQATYNLCVWLAHNTCGNGVAYGNWYPIPNYEHFSRTRNIGTQHRKKL